MEYLGRTGCVSTQSYPVKHISIDYRFASDTRQNMASAAFVDLPAVERGEVFGQLSLIYESFLPYA